MKRLTPSALRLCMSHSLRMVVLCALVVLCVSLGSAVPCQAYADELEEAWADLDAKIAELNALTSSVEDAQIEVTESKQALENVSADISQSQEELASVQKRLASVSRLMYKADEISIWTIIASSQTLDELLSRISQLEAVAAQAANLAQEEKDKQEQLARVYKTATQRKDDAIKAEEDLQRTKVALEESAEGLRAHIADLEEEAALAAAAAEAAAALEAAQKAAQAAAQAQDVIVANPTASTEEVGQGLAPDAGQEAVAIQTVEEQPVADRVVEEPVLAAEEPQDVAPVQEVVEEPIQEAQPTTADTSSWSTGIASAYGGSSDASTPNPGITATGAVCDDYSMGVAVPMAWGPAPYYGRMVEISYNGMTVVATVNDCGGMGGGSRSLDLQPGVFKAFGFSTCQEWGIREVSYRFL